MTSEVEAVAKAVEEVSKATGKAVDASVGLGSFFKEIFGLALKESGNAALDQMQYWRASRLLVLQAKYEQLQQRYNGKRTAAMLPPKFSLPLLEAASEEDDDELTELFARLLFNAVNGTTETEARRAYISVLREMSGFDVKILMALADAPAVKASLPWKTVYTARLPDEFISGEQKGAGAPIEEPPEHVGFSLSNLARLGCVNPGSGWGGVSVLGIVTFTPFGQALARACTIQKSEPEPHG